GDDLTGPAVDVFSSVPTSMPGNFVTRFSLPASALGVAIGEGLGFVADGPAGLQIVNYLAFDSQGRPPTASISLPASAIVGSGTDGNPDLLQGSVVSIQVTLADDVQVRNVELLINGKVVRSSVSFPFDLSALLPTIAQQGTGPVTIQV